MKSISVIPAYGRDYKSKKAIILDLLQGKDFIVCQYGDPWDGKPINRNQMRDQDTGEIPNIQVRYGQLRKVCIVKQSDLETLNSEGGITHVSPGA